MSDFEPPKWMPITNRTELSEDEKYLLAFRSKNYRTGNSYWEIVRVTYTLEDDGDHLTMDDGDEYDSDVHSAFYYIHIVEE